jgi:DNA-binding transcriptional LysR family regulator
VRSYDAQHPADPGRFAAFWLLPKNSIKLFLEHVPRVFAALEPARASVQAAAGYDGQLRIALSDGVTPARLSTLMALCRQEDPDIAIRFSEVPLSQQLKGLHEALYGVGFAQSAEVGDGILAEPAWSDPLHVVVPARHPLRRGRTNALFTPAPRPPAAGTLAQRGPVSAGRSPA